MIEYINFIFKYKSKQGINKHVIGHTVIRYLFVREVATGNISSDRHLNDEEILK